MQGSLTQRRSGADSGSHPFGLAVYGRSPVEDLGGVPARTPSTRRHDLEVVAIPISLALVTLAVCLFAAAPFAVR